MSTVLTAPASDAEIAAAHGDQLNRLVAEAIRHGIDRGQQLALDLAMLPPWLHLPRATFVTLEEDGALRGCVGSIAAYQALATSVAHNAHWAAFHDERFTPVDAGVWPKLTGSISILSPREPLVAADEVAARTSVRPGVDGIVFLAGSRRSVFLPKVWDDLPDPATFLNALKRKAGLPEDYWAADVRLERFTTVSLPPASLASFC